MSPVTIHTLSTLLVKLLLIGFSYVFVTTTIGTTNGACERGMRIRSEDTQKIKYADQILFPSPIFDTTAIYGSPLSTTSGSPSKLGRKCESYDGVPGICIPSAECSVFIHFLYQMYSQRIIQCGTPSLICCPDRKLEKITETTVTPIDVEPDRPSTSMSDTSRLSGISGKPSPTSGSPTNQGQTADFKTTSIPISSIGPSKPFDFTDDEAQNICGVLPEEFNEPSQNKELNATNLWPWIVSIGYRHQNGTIEWICLGSLITTEYILSAAHCFQRSPNVVAIGSALLGRMTGQKNEDLHTIGSIFTHEKFTLPNMYKNIGLGRLTSSVRVTSKIIPVCFPFLAGVLDILQFVGSKAKTIAFETRGNPEFGVTCHTEQYRILNNSQCARVFAAQKAQIIKRFPFGVRGENMCGLNRNTTACQAPGAPLVILDRASESYVQIGISTGDPTCSELKRSIVTFTRLNSFSSWVRDRVGQFPTPPPCYF